MIIWSAPAEVRRRRNGDGALRGFTLLELACALFILTGGLFGVITMYHFGISKTRAINEYAIAMRAIENEVETLRAHPFSELADVEGGPFITEPNELDMLVNARPTVTVRDDFEGLSGLKRVIVTIAWTGENGRTIRKSITTLIADKGKA